MSDKFFFYSKSADKKPGKGTNEYVKNPNDNKDLETIPEWRKCLSNFYITPFELDDEIWNSVEHYFHAVKFRNGKKQGKNYDSNCEYIKQWIPELKDVSNKDILNWENTYSQYKNINYPKPIVNYKTQKELALKMYSSVFH